MRNNTLIVRRVLSMMLVCILTIAGMTGNMSYITLAEGASIDSGELTITYHSDNVQDDIRDATSKKLFYFDEANADGIPSGNYMTPVEGKGGIYLNGELQSTMTLQKKGTTLYLMNGYYDFVEGDKVTISGEFTGVNSSGEQVTVLFRKTIFKYLGTSTNKWGGWEVEKEPVIVDSGNASLTYHSDNVIHDGRDGDSTQAFWYDIQNTNDIPTGTYLTALTGKGVILLNGVQSNATLQKLTSTIYHIRASKAFSVGDMVTVSGQFAEKNSNSETVILNHKKTVFRYLGTELVPTGAWEVIEDPTEEKYQISLSDMQLGDTFTVADSSKVGYGAENLAGKTFVMDVEWSNNGEGGSMTACYYYGTTGAGQAGLRIAFWQGGTQIVVHNEVQNGGGGWDTSYLPNTAKGLDTSKPMRMKTRVDMIDSDLTDTDTAKDDICLNIWIEQNGVEYHIYKDKCFLDSPNFGSNILFYANAYSSLKCTNVEEEIERITFSDVGINDGTYIGTAGASSYAESLAGKELVGEVSYEWVTDEAPNNEYCSIAYGGTDQWSGVQVGFRFDQNILVVVDLVEGSTTYGTMPMEQDAWNLANYDAETLGENRKFGLRLTYVDYDKDGVKDDACFTISINNKKIGEKVYITDGLYLLTNKIYVAPRNSNRSITVASISTGTKVECNGTTLTVTGNGSLKQTALDKALGDAQIEKDSVTEIYVNGEFSTIADGAFNGFYNLQKVHFSENIRVVSDVAFVSCTTNLVYVSCAPGTGFAGGLANAKVVNYMQIDSVGEKADFHNGTLEMHFIPTEAVVGVLDTTEYIGMQVQINDETPQNVTMKKTSYGTLAFTLTDIEEVDFALTILKGTATTTDDTYAVQGFEILESKTVYVNEEAVADKKMAGVKVPTTLARGDANGYYFTTTDALPTGSWDAKDNIYPSEGNDDGVFINGEKTDVYLRKVEDNTYYICLQDKDVTPQAGDVVTVNGQFSYGDVFISFAPITATYTGDGIWQSNISGVVMAETEIVEGSAEDGGNYVVEGTTVKVRYPNSSTATTVSDNTILYQSGDYIISRSFGNVTFEKEVVIYKAGDINANNIVDVRDLVAMKKVLAKQEEIYATKSGQKAAEVLVTGDETDKGELLRQQLVMAKESKTDSVLPDVTGAIGANHTYSDNWITDVDATANGTTVFSITDLNNADKSYKTAFDYDAYGLDYVMDFAFSVDREIRVLQLTDTQIIDAAQERYEDRLGESSDIAWAPENMETLLFDYIDAAVKEAQPDVILLTGDLIYGEFDDNGTSFEALIQVMEDIQIPWAPVFGNHDNESKKGVEWQCDLLENASYCLFKRRHEIGGNGNYSIGLAKEGQLQRVIYMFDSNQCTGAPEEDINNGNISTNAGMLQSQLDWYRVSQLRVNQIAGKKIPSFCGYHVQHIEAGKGLVWAGYQKALDSENHYIIGEGDIISQPGDSGYKYTTVSASAQNTSIVEYMNEVGGDGAFFGHVHNMSTSVRYKGVRWTYGVKTGEYDHHVGGQLGGTLIRLENNENTGETFIVEPIIVNLQR